MMYGKTDAAELRFEAYAAETQDMKQVLWQVHESNRSLRACQN
jgi:hypothetical protein